MGRGLTIYQVRCMMATRGNDIVPSYHIKETFMGEIMLLVFHYISKYHLYFPRIEKHNKENMSCCAKLINPNKLQLHNISIKQGLYKDPA